MPSPVTFPESLADASFVQPDLPDGPCAAGDESQVALFDSPTGEPIWSFSIPRPGDVSVVDASAVYISTRWDRDQHPGIVAIDLASLVPLWQRFLPDEVELMTSTDDSLIVTTGAGIRSIDRSTGDDRWTKTPELELLDIALGVDAAYLLDSVGVHAIDYATGADQWQLPVDRADSVRTTDSTVVVAAGTRLIGVDAEEQTRLFDLEVTRLGAGDVWVFADIIAYELAPSVAPGGGVAVLDRNTGTELWRAESIGEPVWTDGNQLISSTANSEPAPASRFVLIGQDGRTGEELWRIPTTAQATTSVLGTGNQRIVAVDPHPAIAGVQQMRLIDSATGQTAWTTASLTGFDHAVIPTENSVTVFSSSTAIESDRGHLTRTDGAGLQWTAGFPDGIAQAPLSTAYGTLVISGERSPVCISRRVGEPSSDSSVLGASVSR